MDDVLISQLKVLLRFAIGTGIYVGPFALLFLAYWLISLPLRRSERARLFLELLELGIDEGRTPERAIIEAVRSNDPTLGKKFRRFASRLESGASFKDALHSVPRLLPPQISAMLLVGVELGDVRRALPACQQALRDALSQTRGALNYLAILIFVLLPVVPAISIVLSVYVVPKFEMIMRDMSVAVPPSSEAVFGGRAEFVWVQIAIMLFFQFIMLCYIGGPRMKRWLPLPTYLVDRVLWLLPWRRKRMQRDFATMLALLLDAGAPEERALKLAADSSSNAIFIRSAQQAIEQLRAGAKLTDAVRLLDGSGELHWRLTNATHGQGGFMTALRGWFEALDAKAFQQEQAAAQTLTTALVLWNGFVIGAFVIGMFHVLTNIIEEGVLW
jgi:type II secretory pathway component PulF